MHKSLEAVHKELNLQIEENAFTVSGVRNKNTAKFLYNGGTLLTMFNNCARFLSNNEEVKFTEEEITSSLAGHTTVEFEGSQFPITNDSITSLKDHILLSLHQAGSIYSKDTSQFLTDLIPLKYLQTCHPELVELVPGLKDCYERNKTEKERIIAHVRYQL